MIFKDIVCACGSGIFIGAGLHEFGLSVGGCVLIGLGIALFGMIWIEE